MITYTCDKLDAYDWYAPTLGGVLKYVVDYIEIISVYKGAVNIYLTDGSTKKVLIMNTFV